MEGSPAPITPSGLPANYTSESSADPGPAFTFSGTCGTRSDAGASGLPAVAAAETAVDDPYPPTSVPHPRSDPGSRGRSQGSSAACAAIRPCQLICSRPPPPRTPSLLEVGTSTGGGARGHQGYLMTAPLPCPQWAPGGVRQNRGRRRPTATSATPVVLLLLHTAKGSFKHHRVYIQVTGYRLQVIGYRV